MKRLVVGATTSFSVVSFVGRAAARHIKKSLMVTTAVGLACAAPAKADPMYGSAGVDWSGFYGGVHLGYGTGDAKTTGDLSGECRIFCGSTFGYRDFGLSKTGKFQMNGIFGGAQLGHNFRTGNFVFGYEADISASDIKTRGDDNALIELFDDRIRIGSVKSSVDWYGTARGRVGHLLAEDLLIYATGGLAFGEVTSSIGLDVGRNCCGSVSSSDIKLGYSFGGGVEAAASKNFSLKLEYLYVDLGSHEIFKEDLPSIPLITRNVAAAGSSETAFHTFRVGINWHFGSPL